VPKSVVVQRFLAFEPIVEPDVGRWRTSVDAFRQYSNLIKVSEEDLRVLFGSLVDVDAVATSWLFGSKRNMRQHHPAGRSFLIARRCAITIELLVELKDRRGKPVVYFGGKSPLIDFALSNALNSGIRHIGAVVSAAPHACRQFHRLSRPSRRACRVILGSAGKTSPISSRFL
jgi:hypothetical protein